jgi:hypothetical protein
MIHSSPQRLLPESLAYQHALHHWQNFQDAANRTRLDKLLRRPGAFGKPPYIEALNLLPPAERRPVVFGELARYANEFFPEDYLRLREQFLPDASEFELETLEAVKRGELTIPDKLPVTLEEFSSRIWNRALASGSATRLVAAGCHAIDKTMMLYSQFEDLPENENERIFKINNGDIPEIFDLFVLAPKQHSALKNQLVASLVAKVEAGEFTWTHEVNAIIPAWLSLMDEESTATVEKLIQDTLNLIEELKHLGQKRLTSHYRIRKFGRLLFRLGKRKESLRAARALGYSAWAEGWQFQCTDGKGYSNRRNYLIQPSTDADAWQHEPALACSEMSLPLWLMDGVSRVPQLVKFFNQADTFPWVFPQLYHIFQWHLAIAGKTQALGEIRSLSMEHALWFSGFPAQDTEI